MLRWKKSSRSQGNGDCVEVALEPRWVVSSRTANNGNCVEVALEPHWVKSSRSEGNGACVEVAHSSSQMHIRDTKDRSGPVLSVPVTTWRGFIRGL